MILKKLWKVALLMPFIIILLGDSCKKDKPIITNPCPANHRSFLLSPSPAYGSIAQPATLKISWDGAGWNLTYNFYFGTDPDSVKLIFTEKTENSWRARNLKLNTTYYWRVEMFEHGECTQSHVINYYFTTVPDTTRPYI